MKTLEEVLKELKEIEKSRQDIILPMNSLIIQEDGKIKSSTYGEFTPSKPTMRKLCARYKLSQPHMDILAKSGREDLVTETFNHFLKNDRKFMMLRVVGDKRIKGIVDNAYRPFDDFDVFTQVSEYLDVNDLDYDFDILNHDDEYTRFRFRINGFDTNAGMAEENGIDHDILQGGFEITNSEIGSKMGINSLVYRQVCTNGMMGVGSDEENKEIFYKRGHDFNPYSRKNLLQNGLTNAITTSDQSAQLFKKTKDILVTEPVEEFRKIGKRFNLGKTHVDGFTEEWRNEPQTNYFGVINGITRYARNFGKDYFNRSKFELIANDVLEKVTA